MNILTQNQGMTLCVMIALIKELKTLKKLLKESLVNLTKKPLYHPCIKSQKEPPTSDQWNQNCSQPAKPPPPRKKNLEKTQPIQQTPSIYTSTSKPNDTPTPRKKQFTKERSFLKRESSKNLADGKRKQIWIHGNRDPGKPLKM